MITEDSKLQGVNETTYIVGCQSEGTATIVLDSDTDLLVVLNNFLCCLTGSIGEGERYTAGYQGQHHATPALLPPETEERFASPDGSTGQAHR